MLVKFINDIDETEYDGKVILDKIQSHSNIGYCFFNFEKQCISFDKYAQYMLELDELSDDIEFFLIKSIVHPNDWDEVSRFILSLPNIYKSKITFRTISKSGFINFFEAKLACDDYFDKSYACITILDVTLLAKFQDYQKNTLKIAQKYQLNQEKFVKNLSDSFTGGINRILSLCDEVFDNNTDNEKVVEIKQIVKQWSDFSKSTHISLQTSLVSIGNIHRVLVIHNGKHRDVEFWNDMRKNNSVTIDLVEGFNDVMQCLNKNNYDVIVMEAYLMQASGIHIISYIRAMNDVYKDAEIIVWADAIEEDVKRSFFKAGANYFVDRSLLKVIFEKTIAYDDIYGETTYSKGLSGAVSGLYRYIDLSVIGELMNSMNDDEFYHYGIDVLDRIKSCIENIKFALKAKDKVKLLELFDVIATDVKVFGESGISESISLIRDALVLPNTYGLNLVVEDFLKEFNFYIEESEIFLEAFKNNNLSNK